MTLAVTELSDVISMWKALSTNLTEPEDLISPDFRVFATIPGKI